MESAATPIRAHYYSEDKTCALQSVLQTMAVRRKSWNKYFNLRE